MSSTAKDVEIAEPGAMGRERLTAEMAFKDSSIVIKIRRRLPDFLHSVKLKYVCLGYRNTTNPAAYLLFPLLAAAAGLVLLVDARLTVPAVDLVKAFCTSAVSVFLFTLYYLKRPRPVYLVDFACFKPEDKHKITQDGFLEMTESTKAFNGESMDFQTKITTRSGLGDQTYLPPGIQARPPKLCMAEARLEAEAVMFGCLDALFESTGIDPSRDVALSLSLSLSLSSRPSPLQSANPRKIKATC